MEWYNSVTPFRRWTFRR